MYFVNREIPIQLDFINKEFRYYHFISRIMVDYVNKETVFEISSFYNEDDFKNNERSFVTPLTLNDVPRFNVDPSLFAWRSLIENETSPFYRAELQKDYSKEYI